MFPQSKDSGQMLQVPVRRDGFPTNNYDSFRYDFDIQGTGHAIIQKGNANQLSAGSDSYFIYVCGSES
jgi:hypothetical protein